MKVVPDDPEVTVFVTAAEAYPALERAFLSAREEIQAGFRVFDLTSICTRDPSEPMACS